MASGNNNGGCVGLIGVFFVLGILASIPKQVWIVLGFIAVLALAIWAANWAMNAYTEYRTEADKRARAQQAAQEAAARRQQEETARAERERRIALLGSKNATLVEAAQASVRQVLASEAARAGWLGDVDFSDDIRGITDSFQKAHALRKVAGELSALSNPSEDDRRILAEATSTAVGLECAATERVELIGKCASEAHLIDKSLAQERADAKTAEQRAELHGKLSSMLYGIEAAPDTTAIDSTANAVMVRVRAYQEIKSQILRSRES